MKIVKSKEWEKEKNDFLNSHLSPDNDFTIQTNRIDTDGTIMNQYIFNDGSCFYEVFTIVSEYVTFIHKGIEVKEVVDLKRCEYWTTDNELSKFCFI